MRNAAMLSIMLLALLPPCVSFQAHAEKSLDLDAYLAKKMEEVRLDKKQSFSFISSVPILSQVARQYGGQMIAPLDKYLEDPEPAVRRQCAIALEAIGSATRDAAVRREVADRMIQMALKDKSQEQAFFQDLLSYRTRDFSDTAKKTISEKFEEYYIDESKGGHAFRQIILLTGLVEDKQYNNILREIIAEQGDTEKTMDIWWGSRSWAARKALARMGDQGEVEKCIQMVDGVKQEADRARLFGELSFVRQRAVVDYFRQNLIASTQSANTQPTSQTVVSDFVVSSTSAAIGALQQMIEDFPPPSALHLGPDDSARILEINKWFDEHPDYVIIR